MPDEINQTASIGQKKKRRRWHKILLVLLLAVLALIALGPTIVSTGPVRRMALRQINRQIDGELSVNSWSIGWFSGIKLQGISLRDSDSQPVAAVENISLDPSYLSLLGQRAQLGKIRIQKPRLDIRFGADGQTTLEQIGIPLPEAKPEKPTRKQFSFDLQIDDGTVVIHRPEAVPLSVNNIKVGVRMASGEEPLEFRVSCDFADDQGSGKLETQGYIPQQHDGQLQLTGLEARAVVDVNRFALGLISPLLRRAGLDLSVSGLLDGKFDAELHGLQNVQIFGQAICPDIHFFGGMLKTDHFHVRDFSGKVQIDRQGNNLSLEALQIESNLGGIRAQGAMNFGPDSNADDKQASIGSGRLDGELNFDLPKILNQLPSTLHLRPGLSITGGDVTAKYSIASDGDATQFLGNAALKDLRGIIQDKVVPLDEPMELDFDLIYGKKGLEINRLSLNSGFGQLSASGQMKAFGFEGQFELDKFNSQMARFVDLGKLSFAGQVFCKGNIRRKDQLSDLKVSITGQELLVSGLGRQDIYEPQLQINLEGSFSEANDQQRAVITIKQARLASGLAQVESSGQVELKPLAVTAQVQLKSNLDKLWNLASGFQQWPKDMQVQGELDSNLEINTGQTQIISCVGTTVVRNLQVLRQNGAKLYEPDITVQHHLNYSPKSRTLVGELLQVRLAGLKALAEKLNLTRQTDGQLDVQAEGEFRADLAKLEPWMTMFSKLDPKTQLTGKLKGRVSYSRRSGQEHFILASELLDLKVQLPGKPAFNEPKINLDAEVSAERAVNVFELSRLKVASSFLQLNGQATSGLGKPNIPAKVSLQGQCELGRLSQLVRPWISDWPDLLGTGRLDVELTGASPKKAGPEWIRTLSGTAKLDFDQQLLSGLKLGPANVNMQADQGLLRILRSSIPANEGKMTIEGEVNLSDEKPFLAIREPVWLLEDTQINPQMSEAMLKFINPIFANSHQISGRVNLRCDRLSIDELSTWKQDAKMSAQFSGQDLRILSRGGLMQDLVGLLGLDLTAKLGEVSPVIIELTDGVVSYKDMHILFSPLVDLSFSGEVGLDGKLNMKVGVPILPAMLSNQPELIKYLGDQRIYLPITGTVDNPRLDIVALPEILAPLISEALRRLAVDKIGQLFQDLLKPQPKPPPAAAQ